MNQLSKHAEWGQKTGQWVWLLSRVGDTFPAEAAGLVATAPAAGLGGMDAEDAAALTFQNVVVPFTPEEAEEASFAANLILPNAAVYLVEIPTFPDRHYAFADWLVDLAATKAGVRAGLWADVKRAGPYYPGWEYHGQFERMQRAALKKLKAEQADFGTDSKEKSLNLAKKAFQERVSALFDGMRLGFIAEDATALAAAIQYMIEGIAGLKGPNPDPFGKGAKDAA